MWRALESNGPENKKPHAGEGSAAFCQTGDDLLRVGNDVVNGSLDSGDLFGLLVRDFGLEFLFQSHHELDGIKGIGTQVLDEGSATGDFLFLDAKLLGNDFLDAFFDGAHTLFSLLWTIKQLGCA
jgi:hypothetical protein